MHYTLSKPCPKSHRRRRNDQVIEMPYVLVRPPCVHRRALYSNSRLSRTHFLTRFLNSGVFSRHSAAASTFAGDSSFGLESIEMTERRMVSGVWTGDQRSAADS